MEDFSIFSANSIGILVAVIISIVGLWKVFEKAGQSGWAAIIPFYNLYIELKIIKKPIWWMIMLFIPFVNIVFILLITAKLGKAFGKGTGFILGLIFFAPIFTLILGLDESKYIG